jgi:putative phosphoesterase
LKKILLISDTHSFLDYKLIKHIQNADEVWHAGDIGAVDVCNQIEKYKPLKAVYGNIDDQEIRNKFPENNFFVCEQMKVLITHIAGYPNRFSERAKKIIQQFQPQLFICGHSHILKILFDKENNFLFINPGAAGKHGFHVIKTAVSFEIENAQIKNLNVIELGKRNEI